jgi:predicted rRNA methylase YqxC with S4 and FtsJ domains
VRELEEFIAQDTPWQVRDKIYSPIEGSKGNIEFFFHIS